MEGTVTIGSERTEPTATGQVEVLGILHGGISVTDMDASLAFCDGLGLPVQVDAIRDAYLHETLDLPFSEPLSCWPSRRPGSFVELSNTGAWSARGRAPVRSTRPPVPAGRRRNGGVRRRRRRLGRDRREPWTSTPGSTPGARMLRRPDGFWVELLERPR
jgi:hypothetical protein